MHVISNYDVFIGIFKADFEDLFIAFTDTRKLSHTCSWIDHVTCLTSTFNLVE